jgi:3-oxoacyl-[acyl-carrier protein] reductase
MCDVDEVEGHEVAQRLGCNTTFFAVNVADRQAVQVWVDTMADQFGRIDVLVDNRGITRDAQLIRIRDGKLVDMMSEETSDQVIDANLRPPSVAPRW